MSAFDPFAGMPHDPATPPAATEPAHDPNQPAPVAPPPAPAAEADPAAPAAADPAPIAEPSSAFHVGSIVKTPKGYGVVVATGAAPRPDTSGQLVDLAGYVVAQLGDANDLPHTAEELGLEAI